VEWRVSGSQLAAVVLIYNRKAMHKAVSSAEEAIQDVFDGATIMFGGFGLCGNPENLIRVACR